MRDEQENSGGDKENFKYLDIIVFIHAYCGLFAHWENPSTSHTSWDVLNEAGEDLKSHDIDLQALGVFKKYSVKIIKAAEYFFANS